MPDDQNTELHLFIMYQSQMIEVNQKIEKCMKQINQTTNSKNLDNTNDSEPDRDNNEKDYVEPANAIAPNLEEIYLS